MGRGGAAATRTVTGAVRRRLPRLAAVAATVAVGAALVASPPSAKADDAAAFDPVTGYRIARYRAPVHEPPPGATRVTIDGLDALVASDGARLVDVMPAEGASVDPETGAWRLLKARDNIPGSVWLPEVGRGTLSAELERYLARGLDEVTGGDRSRPLVVYCQSDCWMAWNALRRAAALGYRRLYWYAEGVDGWRDHDRPFAPAVPVPMRPGD